MKSYIYIICIAVLGFSNTTIYAQGCVAVKNMASCPLNWGEEPARGWQISLNYRYFRSYKHFRGREEEKERVHNGTEVINNDNSINFGASYTFNNRWRTALFVPYVFIDRSSLYEHLGNNSGMRFHTQSQGLGDIRLITYYSLFPTSKKVALSTGLGVKAPTGDYNAKDYFHKNVEGNTVLQLLPVDQSIQPGDGGLGIITEIDFRGAISSLLQGYVNAMYMLNPRNTNGVLRSPNNTTGVPKGNEFSVPDQYLVRAGATALYKGFQFSLGGRMECIPSRDLIGKSDGFRRPGYIISAEPSVFFTHRQHTIGLNLPIALERNRTQSVLDKERTKLTGNYAHGDAAFADWLLSVTYAYQLAK